MAYTSFGTRKALGKRYSVDPAILLEAQRLEQEYNLAPGREARGIQQSQFTQSQGQQASQFAQNLQMQQDARKGAEQGGMVQSGLGLVQNALMIDTLTGGKMVKGAGSYLGLGGEKLTSGGYNTLAQNSQGFANTAQQAAIDKATAAGTYNPTTGGINYVNPATIDAGAAGAGIATGEVGGMTTASGAVMGSVEEGFAAAGAAGAGAEGAGAAAGTAGTGMSGAAMGGLFTAIGIGAREGGRAMKRSLPEGMKDTVGGKIYSDYFAKHLEYNIVPVDMFVGGQIANDVFGPDSPITQVLNAPTAFVSYVRDRAGTWICTEVDKVDPISKEDTETLSKLRRYAIKNHKEDARAYLKNGFLLIQNLTLDLDTLKIELVEKCCTLVKEDKMEEAFEHYKEVVRKLCEDSGFDYEPLYKEVA